MGTASPASMRELGPSSSPTAGYINGTEDSQDRLVPFTAPGNDASQQNGSTSHNSTELDGRSFSSEAASIPMDSVPKVKPLLGESQPAVPQPERVSPPAPEVTGEKEADVKKETALEIGSDVPEANATPVSAPKVTVKRPRKPSSRVTKTDSRAKSKPKRLPKKIVKLKFLNATKMPNFRPLNLQGALNDQFWLRLNIREFLLRFDKLVRLPTKHASAINDPLQQWSDQLYKACLVAMLKVLQNDTVPLFPQSHHYLQEIEHTVAESPNIWVLVQDFLSEADPYVDPAVEGLGGETFRLELVRRLMVLTTGTETIRVTVTGDNDQLRALQQDANAEVRKLEQHWKATEKKLDNLRKLDPETWRAKVDAAHNAHLQRVYRVRQTLHLQLHKYNLRTAPIGRDCWGNEYWSLQYKNKDYPDWGTWLLVKSQIEPAAIQKWQKQFAADVQTVLDLRSAPRGEKEKGKRYPKLKIKRPTPAENTQLYILEGRETISQLSAWLAAEPHANQGKLAEAISGFAEYVAI